MIFPDKLLFVHHGALGDFLLAWPAMQYLAQWAGGGKEERNGERIGGEPPFLNKRGVPPAPPSPQKILIGGTEAPGGGEIAIEFVGDRSRMMWLEPLGVRWREPDTARTIDRLYGLEDWPAELEGTVVAWFGLAKAPPVPDSPNLWFLQGVEADRRVSPRELYLDGLARRLGGSAPVPTSGQAVAAFRALFAGSRTGAGRDRTVLLFPGAGHPRKEWGVVKYLELASRLEDAGLEPIFVMGPVEQERGIDLGVRACVTPGGLLELQDLLLTARAVVGGDTGPLHLAGMLGVPIVSLFGPTDPKVWSPFKAHVVVAPADCAPCAARAGEIDCRHGRCLEDLDVETVWEVLRGVLGGAT